DATSLEEVELSDERRAEILAMEVALQTQNAFQLLGAAPGAAASEVRTAFYELSRKFHPDRFFGKNLGSFRARVEKIFLRLSQAHELLTDEGKRAKYLKEHAVAAAPNQAGPSPRPSAPLIEPPRPRTAED